MARTDKNGEDRKSQKGPAPRRNHRVVRLLQGALSRFLSWLSSLFKESNIPKALAGQILRAAHRWVARMSPVQFIYLGGALVVITVIAMLYILFGIPRRGDGSDNGRARRSITVWVSEMEGSTESDDTFEVRNLIKKYLSVFEVETSEPVDSGRTVITVPVGCYRAERQKAGMIKELRVAIPELKWQVTPQTYAEVPDLPVDKIARDIGTRILYEYPAEGTIYELQPKKDAPSGGQRKVYLDIGYLDGVREGEVFRVIPLGGGRPFRHSTITIFGAGSRRSTAHVPWEQQIEEGWGVKWIEAGYLLP